MGTLSMLKKKPLTVLIVEDDDELREILHAEFELEGLTVLTATDGSEAVTTVRETRHIPIVMLTAAGNKEDIVKGLEVGAIDYITKPFFMPELKARLRAILQHKIMYDELKRIQDTLIRNERLRTMSALTEAVQGSVNEPLTLIFGRIHLLRRKEGVISKDDLRALENAANKIKDIINHLGIMECLYPAPLLGESDFVDLPFLN
jgi:DNA-binding response OmpR family regulator